MAKSVAQRKQAQRDRDTKMGIKTMGVKVSVNEANDIDVLRQIRGGESGAYSVDEYITTLIREDKARLFKQLGASTCCAACSDTFASGEHGPLSINTANHHPIGREDLQIVTRHKLPPVKI